jgi:putative hemolysin
MPHENGPPSLFSIGSMLAPRRRSPILSRATRLADRTLGLPHLRTLYEAARSVSTDDFAGDVLAAAGVGVAVSERDLLSIPSNGPLVIVANHPFGAVEGLVLLSLVRRVRGDVRLMANHLLAAIPELEEEIIAVDPFGSPGSALRNLRAMRRSIQWVRGGGALIVFPAGEVSSRRRVFAPVIDPPWSTTIARIVDASGSTVVPVRVDGRNRELFQMAGLLHRRLRTALLPREMLQRRGSKVSLAIGRPIPIARLRAQGDATTMTDYLRARTDALGLRFASDQADDERALEPIDAPIARRILAAEVDALDRSQCLHVSGSLEVWHATAGEIPATLHEIGRLREIAFRAVGEGSGRAVDLDRFDEHYTHLFVWDREQRQVIGAYRLGLVDEIVRSHGRRGLYTHSLFRLSRAVIRQLGPAIEAGRAFVRLEHQRTYAPLLLLWKGIGEFVSRHPRHRKLFGPLSISAAYSRGSRESIADYLWSTARETRLARPRARSPFAFSRDFASIQSATHLLARNLDELSWTISDIETEEMGVPVLLKLYLKLGARVLGFNVDESFGGCVDGLIVVDLDRADPELLQRFIGGPGARTQEQRDINRREGACR